MLTKRDLLASLAGMAGGPILLLGLAYLVGGKEILAPLNQAADQMLEWIKREKHTPSSSTPSAPPVLDDQRSPLTPQETAPHGSAGMTMSTKVTTLHLLACPRTDCATIASIPEGENVVMLGNRAGNGATEWARVRFERHEGWVARHDLE